MTRALLLISTCAMLAACGRVGDSGLNPLRWFGGGDRGPQTLEPKGGWGRQADARLPVGQLLTARWEPTVEGRLLVVTALAPTRGWWDVALVTQTPQPAGRVRPDADGVLRLRLVGVPPLPDDPAGRLPARPGADTLTVAFPVSTESLGRIDKVEIAGAANGLSLGV